MSCNGPPAIVPRRQRRARLRWLCRVGARATALAAVLLVSACASNPDSPAIAYKKAESVKPLSVPPDLTEPEAPGALELPEADVEGAAKGSARALMPQFEGIRFVRAGSSVWLELPNTDATEIWPRLGTFIESQGLEVAEADPALGIVTTEWAERFDNPQSGGLTGLLSSIFGGQGEPVYDRYQFSLERMDDGGTRIVLAHRRAQKIGHRTAHDDGAVASSGSPLEFEWRRGSGSPAVRTEMMKRLMVRLGMAEQRAQGVIADARSAAAVGPAPQYFETDWGRAWVVVDDDGVRRVFARVEQALTDIGAETDEADFDQRSFRVRWAPSAASGAEAERQTPTVFVRKEDGVTRITAGDADGTERSGREQKALLRALTAAMGGDPGKVQRPADAEEGGSDRHFGRPRSIMSPRRD